MVALLLYIGRHTETGRVVGNSFASLGFIDEYAIRGT
jgi:hypothetical protein